MQKRSLLYGATVLTGSAIATQLLGFAYRVQLTRMMGAEAMGVYHLVMSVYSVVISLCLSGLSTASARLSAQYKATLRQDLTALLIKRLFCIFAVLALICGALLLLGDRFIARNILAESRAEMGITLLVPVILLTGVENILKNHFIGVGKVLPEAVCETVEMVLRAASAVVLLIIVNPASAESAVACVICAMAVSEVFSSCAMAVLYKKGAVKGRGAASAPIGRAIASVAVPAALTSFAANLLGSANNVMIPARLMAGGMDKSAAMSAIGEFFGMTVPMVALPAIMIDGLLGVLMPSLSDHMARGEIIAVRRKASKAFPAVIFYIVLALTIMIPLFPVFAKGLYANFDEYKNVFLLCVWMAISCIRSVSSVVMTGIGKQGAGALTFIAGSVLQLGFTWYLTPLHGLGMRAVALGMIAAALLTLVLNLGFIRKYVGIKIRFVTWFVCPVVSALGAYCLSFALVKPIEGAAGAMFVRAVLTAAVYLLLMRAMGIRLRELFVIRRKNREVVR